MPDFEQTEAQSPGPDVADLEPTDRRSLPELYVADRESSTSLRAKARKTARYKARSTKTAAFSRKTDRHNSTAWELPRAMQERKSRAHVKGSSVRQ